MEIVMVADGDDAAHCSNGLTAQKFREATAEERAIYRRWLRGTVAFYALVLLVSGVAAVASYSSASRTQLSSLSPRH
jgi:hypothetical protein